MPSVALPWPFSGLVEVRVSSRILWATFDLFGEGFDTCGVEAGVRFGDAKTDLHLAGNEVGDPAVFLFGRAVHQHRMRAEHVHVNGRRCGHAAAVRRHGVHHQRGFLDAEPRAAVLLGHGDAKPSVISHGAVEFLGETFFFFASSPVVVAKSLAYRRHAVDDRSLFSCEIEH
jgi:hypothetical protein